VTFSPEHVAMILAGRKTETRRLGMTPPRYRVGHVYAVQPGRGRAAVGHIRILDLDRQMVREVSNLQARAEGYDSVFEFWSALNTVNGREVRADEWVTAYKFELEEETTR